MYANNRALDTPRAIFRTAGGSIYTYSHPFLGGQLAVTPGGNALSGYTGCEVDVSSSLKLNDTFFNAQPAQANALQEVMVDGTTITITNHLMNGTATVQVVPGTGLVRDGDLCAIAPFIASAKDNIGGVLCRRRYTTAGALTRVYYGVSWTNFPHDVDAGNAVPVYTMSMLYSGWFEGLITVNVSTEKEMWAVGNMLSIKGTYVPFDLTKLKKVDTSSLKPTRAIINSSTPGFAGVPTLGTDVTSYPD